VEILARTLWGEARGEGAAGMEAVAAVVVNRLKAGRPRWGLDLGAVCLARRQFSCWNPGDPNRAKLLAVTPADPAFATALRIARRAASGLLPDPVLGATHYHTRGVMPGWSIGQRPVATIGRHLFYAGIA
jgi:spore germination cell wall hydrolase CwlJ-like protein